MKSNVSFILGESLEPRVFTKGRYIRLIFPKKEKEKPLYKNQRIRFFSRLLREKNFLVLVALVVIKAPTRQVQIEPES